MYFQIALNVTVLEDGARWSLTLYPMEDDKLVGLPIVRRGWVEKTAGWTALGLAEAAWAAAKSAVN